ncbi:MAG: aspartate carbamoyltransferase catalytic subunit [Dethiobacteria bacterium]|jgi:aspartate carbamoyltransferase catalytic subunit
MLKKDLLGLYNLDCPRIETILEKASFYKRNFKGSFSILKGKTVAILFFEPSTRTRLSFELAIKRLGGEVLNFNTELSSVLKGESLVDTVQSIEALGVDGFIIRHGFSGAVEMLAGRVDKPVINAGDGAHEHPTQALLDLLTLKEAKGSIAGLRVLMVGDITHSRVVRSSIYGLKAAGAKVRLIGPPTLLPQKIEYLGVETGSNLDEALPEADVVYLLRIQLERQRSGLFPSMEEYSQFFGLTKKRLQLLKPGTIVMHPGPVNVGAEITAEALAALEDGLPGGTTTFIKRQVTNGVVVRMAILDLLLGGKGQ